MAPLIRRLLVKRFRSFVLGEVEFDDPTFLVGRNGAGKTWPPTDWLPMDPSDR